MSRSKKTPVSGASKPSLRDTLKPVEFLVIAAVLAVFVGLVVLLATREPILAVIFFGIAFIVVLIVLAMFTLTMKPNESEKKDLAERDGGDDRPGPLNPHD